MALETGWHGTAADAMGMAAEGLPVGAGLPPQPVLEEAARVHVSTLRQEFEALRRFDPTGALVRRREVFWCVAEATHALMQDRWLRHKDLVALAGGTISPATLTRAVAEAVEYGLLTLTADPQDGRVRQITPTARGMRLLAGMSAEPGALRESLSVPAQRPALDGRAAAA